MARIAAVIAAIVLPVATFAQVVVYAAKRVDMPGHSVARRIVAPFTQELPTRASASASQSRASAVPVADDAPLVRPLPLPANAEPTAPAVEPSASLEVTAPRAGIAPVPAAQPTPDRARIAALATQHQSAVVRGETEADYIVMVVNASSEYVWSTHGIGSASIEVAGDTRTAGERSAYNREHRAELTGGVRGAGGRGGAAPDSLFPPSRVLRLGADTVEARAGGAVRGVGGGGRGGAGGRVIAEPDTVRLTSRTGTVGRGGGGGRAGGAVDTARAQRLIIVPPDSSGTRYRVSARGATGGAFIRDPQGGAPSSYKTGWTLMRDGEVVTNRARGLQDAGEGESGIQGLPSTSVALADLYTFAAGSLAPQYLRILVVHLTPGTVWSGR